MQGHFPPGGVIPTAYVSALDLHDQQGRYVQSPDVMPRYHSGVPIQDQLLGYGNADALAERLSQQLSFEGPGNQRQRQTQQQYGQNNAAVGGGRYPAYNGLPQQQPQMQHALHQQHSQQPQHSLHMQQVIAPPAVFYQQYQQHPQHLRNNFGPGVGLDAGASAGYHMDRFAQQGLRGSLPQQYGPGPGPSSRGGSMYNASVRGNGGGGGGGFPQARQKKKRTQVGLEDNVRRTVYISYIDHQVTEEQLATFFQECGRVLDCRICGDPNSAMRFAFIEFFELEAAQRALGKTGSVLGGSPLRVLPSKTAIVPVSRDMMPRTSDEIERCSRTVYAANIDKKVDRNDVRHFFESLCGPVSKIRLLGDHAHSTRIAFIEFVHAEAALAALNCSGALLGSMPIRVSPSKTPVRPDSKDIQDAAPAAASASNVPPAETPPADEADSAAAGAAYRPEQS